jgi:hypothetical protein
MNRLRLLFGLFLLAAITFPTLASGQLSTRTQREIEQCVAAGGSICGSTLTPFSCDGTDCTLASGDLIVGKPFNITDSTTDFFNVDASGAITLTPTAGQDLTLASGDFTLTSGDLCISLHCFVSSGGSTLDLTIGGATTYYTFSLHSANGMKILHDQGLRIGKTKVVALYNDTVTDGILRVGPQTAGTGTLLVRTEVDNTTNYQDLSLSVVDGTATIACLEGGTGSDNCDIDMPLLGTGGFNLANSREGGTGNIGWFWAYESHTLAASTSSTTTLSPSIASGDIVYGCLMTVDTAVVDDAGDDTWSADWDTSLASTAMSQGVAAAQDTKANFLFVPLKATGAAEVVFTPNAGNFSAGVIELQCLVQSATNMADA